jgi:hypothetical protein
MVRPYLIQTDASPDNGIQQYIRRNHPALVDVIDKMTMQVVEVCYY